MSTEALPTAQDAVTLEVLIDRIGLYETLSMIEAICAEKAHHIRASYGDEVLADTWQGAGADIAQASSGDSVEALS